VAKVGLARFLLPCGIIEAAGTESWDLPAAWQGRSRPVRDRNGADGEGSAIRPGDYESVRLGRRLKVGAPAAERARDDPGFGIRGSGFGIRE